jgi:hypothetical protein
MELTGNLEALVTLSPGKECQYPNMRLRGPQSQSWYFGEEKKLFPLLGFEPDLSSP